MTESNGGNLLGLHGNWQEGQEQTLGSQGTERSIGEEGSCNTPRLPQQRLNGERERHHTCRSWNNDRPSSHSVEWGEGGGVGKKKKGETEEEEEEEEEEQKKKKTQQQRQQRCGWGGRRSRTTRIANYALYHKQSTRKSI